MPDLLDIMGAAPAIRSARPVEPIARHAEISACGTYRWTLRRRWGAGPEIGWVMLNPSTADGTTDDPTSWRVIGFTDSWGFRACTLVNLYPFRSPSPDDLWRWRLGDCRDAMRENRERCLAALGRCDMLVAAWGVVDIRHGVDLAAWLGAPGDTEEMAMGRPWHCIGTTEGGWPKHPLARGLHRVPMGAPALPFVQPIRIKGAGIRVAAA